MILRLLENLSSLTSSRNITKVLLKYFKSSKTAKQSTPSGILYNIFSLLNMKDTGFYVERKNWNRIAEPFKNKEPSLINITKKPLFFKGGHGLVSTVPDYINFCHMMLNKGKFKGNQLLSKKTVEYMTTNHLHNKIKQNRYRILILIFLLWIPINFLPSYID